MATAPADHRLQSLRLQSRDRRERYLILAALLFTALAAAQDERRVTSPNGQLEFRLFIATQANSNLSRIAYEVFYRNKPLISTSYLGLDIQDQEPLLGENVGLTSSSSATSPRYNSLTAKYMQNGSLGRLINVEVRAYNDGAAFRYVIPPSTPLMDFVIAEESTEFHFTENLEASSVVHLSSAWVAISESVLEHYPRMRLIRANPTTDVTLLDQKFQGSTPLTCPWRIISIGSSNKTVLKTEIIADLNH